ncbi:MAG: phosphohistidine phosphatase SixA [Nitrososphaerales archaeon]
MNVFILRHGEAGRRLPIPSKDFERPLTEAGQKEIEEIARSFDKLDLKFDLIISSPLKRCHDTASIVAKEQNSTEKLEDWEELKPEGMRSELVRKLSRLKQDSDVLLVGHDPYLSILISEIVSGVPNVRLALKKGGLARIQMTSFAPKANGELKWLLTPRHLKRLK